MEIVIYIIIGYFILIGILSIIDRKNELKEKEYKKIEMPDKVFQKEVKKEEVIVVFKISDFKYFIKRSNNTFAYINNCENEVPYKLNERIEIESEKLENWNWCDEKEYIKLKIKESFNEVIKQNLLNYGIKYLYHMTHKDNLESILRNGLKSNNEIRKENVNNIDISDNEVNNRRARREYIFNRSIHDYVPLYFNPKNPMLYVRKNIQDDIIILAINPMLLYNYNTLFTNGNAASNTTSFYKSVKNLENLDWDCINAEYWSDFQDGKRIRCSEILIYPSVEVSHIMKIFCNNSFTREFVKHKIDNFANQEINVEIEPDLYF